LTWGVKSGKIEGSEGSVRAKALRENELRAPDPRENWTEPRPTINRI